MEGKIVYTRDGMRIVHWRNVQIIHYAVTPTMEHIKRTEDYSRSLLIRYPAGILGMVLVSPAVGVPPSDVRAASTETMKTLGAKVVRLVVISEHAQSSILARTAITLVRAINVLVKSKSMYLYTNVLEGARSFGSALDGDPSALAAEVEASRPVVQAAVA